MSEMWQCTEVRARLALFVGGDLEADETQRVGAHLAACTDCDRELQRLATARARWTSLQDEALPAERSVWNGVREQLQAEGWIRAGAHDDVRREPARKRVASLWRWSVPAAAAAALIAFSVISRDASPVELQAPAKTPTVAVTPVANGGALRRLAPGEKALMEQGDPQFLDFPSPDGRRRSDSNQDVWLVSDDELR